MVDPAGVAALLGVSVEWLALGWLSGVAWPDGAPWGPTWSLRLLAGASLTGLSLLLLAVFGVPFGLVPGLAVAAVLAGGLRLLATRLEPRPFTSSSVASGFGSEQKLAQGQGREWVGWTLLGLVLAAAVVRALVVPEAGWDAYSHWGLKAKAAFLARGIIDTNTAHEYYPPLVPLLEAWLYLHRGAALIDLGKTVWAPVGAAFAVCLAWHLRLCVRPAWLAPLVSLGVLLATTELLESFFTGQGDLALTAFLTLATLAIFQYQRQSQPGWLIQAALFGLAAGLTKYEGLFRVGVVVLAVLVEGLLGGRSRRLLPAAGSLAVGALVGYLPWVVFRDQHQIAVTSEHLSRLQLGATGAVLAALAVAFAGVRTGGGLLVGLVGLAAGLIGGAGRDLLTQPPLRLLGLVVLGQLIATLLAFLVTDYSPVLQVQLSATRLVEQWLPVALFGVAAWSLAREPYTGPVER